MLLALDTATRLASAALYDGTRVVSEHTWHSANRHTVELMPHVVAMTKQVGLTPTDLQVVAVALGPGSFTGLRIALSVAKGLAIALNVPLLGVPTLDIVAYPHQQETRPVCAVVQAGRGRVCWARYGARAGIWTSQEAYRLSTVDTLACVIDRPTLFVGELLPETTATLRNILGEKAYFAPPALSLRRAGYLAEMAWGRWRRGEQDDPVSLSPIYLHEPPGGGTLP